MAAQVESANVFSPQNTINPDGPTRRRLCADGSGDHRPSREHDETKKNYGSCVLTVVLISRKKDPPKIAGRLYPKSGGGGGIRTRGTFPFSGFQDRCNKPLYHPSNSLLASLHCPGLWKPYIPRIHARLSAGSHESNASDHVHSPQLRRRSSASRKIFRKPARE